VTLAAGEILAFAAFFVGEAVLKSPAPHATLAQPGVLRAVLLSAAIVTVFGLLALGAWSFIRRDA
jgi:ABC-2 type transport system permease protein